MTLIAAPIDDAIAWGWGDYDVLPITADSKSKKAMRAFIEAHPDTPCLIDPSVRFFGAPNDQRTFTPREAITAGKEFVVTNHPRRTWFGTLLLDKHGNPTLK